MSKIDNILRNNIVLATDNGQPYIKYTEDATQTIKQLFQKLIDEVIGGGDHAIKQEQRQRAKELIEKL